MNKPFFAGREAELERLVALSEETFAGTAQIAFITGEAGIGKTALAQELLRIVQEKRGDVGRSEKTALQIAERDPAAVLVLHDGEKESYSIE